MGTQVHHGATWRAFWKTTSNILEWGETGLQMNAVLNLKKTEVCHSDRTPTASSPQQTPLSNTAERDRPPRLCKTLKTYLGEHQKKWHPCSFCCHTDAVPQAGPAVQKRLSNLQSGVCHLLAPTLAETRLRVASMLRLEVSPFPGVESELAL